MLLTGTGQYKNICLYTRHLAFEELDQVARAGAEHPIKPGASVNYAPDTTFVLVGIRIVIRRASSKEES